MLNGKIFVISFFYLLSLIPSFVNASTISTTTDEGTIWEVGAVEKWQTTGNLMNGISVTVTYKTASGYSSDTLYWNDDPTNPGVVSTLGWSLTLNDFTTNTFDNSTEWIFSNTGALQITNLTLDGKSGNTVFDILDVFVFNTTTGLWEIDEVTLDSERGKSVSLIDATSTNPGLIVSATYKNAVALNGSSPLEDLYQTLSLDFSYSGGQDYFGVGTIKFTLDTDNVNPVPEPATMLLLALGLCGIGSIRTRRN